MKHKLTLAQTFGILLITGCSSTTPSVSQSQSHPIRSQARSIAQSDARHPGANPQNPHSQILTPQDMAAFDQEYAGFKTLALTQDYLLKKIQRWIGLNDGVRLVRELEYGRLKYPSTLADLYTANPSLKTTTANFPEVIMARSQNPDFDAFIGPLLATAAALSITNLQASAGIGEQVTLQGSHFSSVSSVSIQGVSANFSVASDTQMSVQIPASATSGNLVLTAGSETASQALTISNRVWFVNSAATGTGDGSSWANAYPDLQAALAAVSAAGGADQIWIAAGTYKPSSSGNREAYFNVPANTSVYGGFAGTESFATDRNLNTNHTILSGDLNGNDVYSPSVNASLMSDNSMNIVHHQNNVMLDGFIIEGGAAINPDLPPYEGAGINSGANNSLILRNSTLRYNLAAQKGAGWYNGAGTATLTNVTFEKNNSWILGGGIYNDSGHLTLEQLHFSGNYTEGAGGTGGGSGIYNHSGTLTLSDSNFESNSTYVGGGAGIYNNTGTLNLARLSFSNNLADAGLGGAGIYNGSGSVTITDSSFTGNRSLASGGGYRCDGGSNTLSNTSFSHSHSDDGGGGLYISAGILNGDTLSFTNNSTDREGSALYASGGTIELNNSNFDNNISNGFGGAISSSGIALTLTNASFTNNQAYYSGGAINMLGGSLTINSGSFSNNSATIQGGAQGGALSLDGADLNLNQVDFDTHSSTWVGGTINLWSSSDNQVNLTDVTIKNSSTADMGGGIYLSNSLGNGTASLTRVKFQNSTIVNQSGDGGCARIEGFDQINIVDSSFDSCSSYSGGGALSAYPKTAVTISGSQFTNNHSSDLSGSRGGAIAIWGIGEYFLNQNTTVLISNSFFTGNSATGVGGALCLDNIDQTSINNTVFNQNTLTLGGSPGGGGAIFTQSGDLVLNQVSFGNNDSFVPGSNGDAIYMESGNLTLRNSLIWDSGAAPIFLNGGTLSSLYSVLKGLSGYSLQPGSTGNVDADPLFSNAADPDGADNILGTADDGLALQAGSPALNLDTSGAGPLALDILGLARVGNPDAGAYEKQ